MRFLVGVCNELIRLVVGVWIVFNNVVYSLVLVGMDFIVMN